MDTLKKIWKVVAFFLIPFLSALLIMANVLSYCGRTLFGVEYRLSDDGNYYILSDYGGMNFSKTFEVPEEYNGKPVVEIDEDAFSLSIFLNEVVISGNVTSIGDRAFYYFNSLKRVVIGDSVTTIGDSAFSGCGTLTDVYYTGTESEWAAITVGPNNAKLKNATIHYNYVPEE